MSKRNGKWTATQGKLMALLGDGLSHHRDELRACLNDSEATYQNVSYHLVYIRRVLRPKGQDILCELVRRQIHYRYVRLMHSAADGKY